jgi:hypothetical protein
MRHLACVTYSFPRHVFHSIKAKTQSRQSSKTCRQKPRSLGSLGDAEDVMIVLARAVGWQSSADFVGDIGPDFADSEGKGLSGRCRYKRLLQNLPYCSADRPRARAVAASSASISGLISSVMVITALSVIMTGEQAECGYRLALLYRCPPHNGLAPVRLDGKLECLPDGAIEGVFFGNPAVVAFVNRRLQRGKLRLIAPFLALQCSERRADNLAGIFVTPAPDFGQNEAVELICQIHIASRH